MEQEKRVKLGVDVGALANELLQINRLTEQNYKTSIQGQQEYNTILDISLQKLNSQIDKLGDIDSLIKKIGEGSVNINFPNFQQQGGNSENTINIDFDEVNTYLELIIENQERIISVSSNKNEGGDVMGGVGIGIILERLLDGQREQSEIFRNGFENLGNLGGNNDKIEKDDPIKQENDNNDIINAIYEVRDPLVSINETVTNIWNHLNTPDNNGGGGGRRGNQADQEEENENDRNKKNDDSSNLQKTSTKTAGIITQKNDVYMAAAMAALIPVVGQGVSMVMQRLIGAAENYDISQHAYRAVSGREGMEGFTDIGLSNAQAYQKQAQYIRSNVRLNREDLLFEKGFGLSSETLSSLLQSTRNEQNQNVSSSRLGADYLGFLTTTTNRNTVRAYSEEYLKLLVDINQRQLDVAGQTNTAVNGKIITGISGLSDTFKDPNVLSGVITKVYQGLTTANSPQVEALQYEVLGRMNPNANLWELEKLRQDPFSDGGEYLKNFITELSSIGRPEEGYFNVATQFGMQAGKPVEDLVNGIREGRFKTTEELRNAFNKAKGFNIQNEAGSSTSILQQSTADTENLYAKLGLPLATGLANLGEKAKSVIEEFSDLVTGTKSLNEVFADLADYIKNAILGTKAGDKGLGYSDNEKRILEDLKNNKPLSESDQRYYDNVLSNKVKYNGKYKDLKEINEYEVSAVPESRMKWEIFKTMVFGGMRR